MQKKEKIIKFNNNDIEIVFKGIEKKHSINYEYIDNLLKNIFLNFKGDDVIQCLTYIRSILKNFDERELDVKFHKDNVIWNIKYISNVLTEFYKKEKMKNTDDTLLIKYDLRDGVNVKIFNEKLNISDYENYKDISEYVSKSLPILYQLNHIKVISLDRDSRLLCQMYILFYNERPDFSKKQTHTKAQVMMCILNELGYSLGEEYTFTVLSPGKMPISMELVQLFNKLMPFGEVHLIDEPVEMMKDAELIIKQAGVLVRGYSKGLNGRLIKLSSIFYAKENILSLDAVEEEIAQYLNYSEAEVHEGMLLIREINKVC